MSKNSTNGFGIIECLISILLLTFFMVGGMSFYIYSNSYIKATTYKRIAADLANSKMEGIKQAGYDSPSLPLLGACLDDTTPKIWALPATIRTCVVADGPDGPSYKPYKHVTVNVSWTEPGSQPVENTPRSIMLDSFITKE